MTKELNTFLRKQLDRKMHEQEKLRYPSFKKGIAEDLVEKFGVKFDDALCLAFMPEIDKKIMEDISWSQHMGTDYWAEVIFHNYCNNSIASV